MKKRCRYMLCRAQRAPATPLRRYDIMILMVIAMLDIIIIIAAQHAATMLFCATRARGAFSLWSPMPCRTPLIMMPR